MLFYLLGFSSIDDYCGVVTVFHGGIFKGGADNVQYEGGEKSCVYVDGEDYSEYKLADYLKFLGYEIRYIKGVYFKGENELMSNVKPFNGFGYVRHVAEELRLGRGVHIYVDHEVNGPTLEPELIEWVEEVNEFEEEDINNVGLIEVVASSENEGLRSVYEGSTDDEVVPPNGKNLEYNSIIGARRGKKRQAIEEEMLFF